jgi:hypothetical protein
MADTRNYARNLTLDFLILSSYDPLHTNGSPTMNIQPPELNYAFRGFKLKDCIT